MYAATRTVALLDDRLNADFYAPHYIDIETRIQNCGIEPLHLGRKLARVFKGAFYLLASEYQDSGIPFIRVTQISTGSVNLSESVYISESAHRREHKTAVKPGYLLFAKGGAYRHCAVVPRTVPEANICQDLIGAATSDDLDSHYVFAFLASRFGRPQLIRWEQGDAQPHLSNDSVKHILLPFPTDCVQKYIGDKVRQAEQLQAFSSALDRTVFQYFDTYRPPLNGRKQSWRVEGLAIDSYRINAPHYDCVVLEMLTHAQTLTRLVPLEAIIAGNDMSGGATPLGANYSAEGIFFARVQNVSALRINRSDAAYLSPTQDEELRRSRCRANDVVLTITGYPGSAAVISEEDLPLNINQHSVRFTVKEEWHPGFVAAAINSDFGRRQVNRLAIGGTRDALDYPSVKSLLIPESPPADRRRIGKLVEVSNRALRCAGRLTIAARMLVEALIEGRISEAELIGAQRSLVRGDETIDRAVLSRLSEAGLDIADKPGLFPDLDVLYEAIEESQRIESCNGDAK